MKKYLSVILLTANLIGCTAPVTVTTPQGQAAYTADKVVNLLGIFQDAAIGAQSQGLLSVDHTRLIVTFVKSAVTTASSAPSGFKAIVTTELQQLQKALGADEAKYDNYFNLLFAALAGLS